MFRCSATTPSIDSLHPNRASFIATDPGNRASRIPADTDCELAPGEYIWRVAAVPEGSKAEGRDEPKRLSEWSGYASFTFYPYLMDRIVTTKRVRLGANLEQGSRFARRTPDGQIVGFEIYLVRNLVDCLALDGQKSRLVLPSSCPGKEEPKALNQSENCPDDKVCIEFVPITKWGDWQTALKRKEIDIFIGGATAARERSRSGIQFTTGYLTYQTKLYTHRPDGPPRGRRTLASWLIQDRTVGVIADSSNEELLDLMLLEQKRRQKFPGEMTKQTFSSFPELEYAMDRGLVDGALVDETFVDDEPWVPIDGLDKDQPEAWKNYRISFLGEDKEQIAIAVAVDEDQDAAHDGQLITLLNSALGNPAVKRYVQRLCTEEWKSKKDSGAGFCKVGR